MRSDVIMIDHANSECKDFSVTFFDMHSGQSITPLRSHNFQFSLEYSGISFLIDCSQANS